jgi:hypothetical protein
MSELLSMPPMSETTPIEFSNERRDNKEDTKDDTQESGLGEGFRAMTYRFKFSGGFTDILYRFSKIHQYDDRHAFKEAWEQWTETHESEVTDEINRLRFLGYDGDINDKMYKSARYYFRKKRPSPITQTKRKQYVQISRELLIVMDEHIIRGLTNGHLKPQDGFLNFCETHMELVKEAVNGLYKSGMTNSDELHMKIKKTYKNRYSIIVNH